MILTKIDNWWYKEIARFLLCFGAGFIFGSMIQLWRVIMTFPIDSSNIIHVTPVVAPTAGNQTGEAWASYYNYDLPGYPDYGLTHATAAHRVYLRGTVLKVTSIDSGKSVIIKVNDFGPEPCLLSNNYHQSGSPDKCIERQIDLSTFAYQSICSTPRGLCKVNIELYGKN